MLPLGNLLYNGFPLFLARQFANLFQHCWNFSYGIVYCKGITIHNKQCSERLTRHTLLSLSFHWMATKTSNHFISVHNSTYSFFLQSSPFFSAVFSRISSWRINILLNHMLRKVKNKPEGSTKSFRQRGSNC